MYVQGKKSLDREINNIVLDACTFLIKGMSPTNEKGFGAEEEVVGSKRR
jgi:hypothetical protein